MDRRETIRSLARCQALVRELLSAARERNPDVVPSDLAEVREHLAEVERLLDRRARRGGSAVRL